MTSLAKARRQAEIEIFKLEREREENYMRTKADMEHGSDTMSVTSATSDGWCLLLPRGCLLALLAWINVSYL